MHCRSPQRFLQANQGVELCLVAFEKEGAPSQVMSQVLGGHPMKADHPALQSAVVGVRVLDAEGAIDPELLAQIDRLVGNAFHPGKVGIDGSTVRAKDRIGIDQGL